MPRHVAVIIDCNGRRACHWGLPGSSGHEAGIRPLRELVELCGKWGIKVLTLLAFSSGNWSRSKEEVDFLMDLLERLLQSGLEIMFELIYPVLNREGMRISTIGDSSKLPNYSGKYDISRACKSIAHKAKDGIICLEDIDEKLIEKELSTSCTEVPCPDLLIQTGGELRLSNFLLWQLAYIELYFTQALWPDFRKTEFVEALHSFQQRKRWYGSRDS
ncbi:hypothetical protein CRG98_041189 [Punica granatum]|uniref:Alkyl transferase n=1 Tax=Punica granatum TaxID=22663 RepID=A0A2I0I339_PUNGR|nr:hypothetical protein CRG98_041189 [Punica granatum]